MSPITDARVARNAVAVVFALNGFVFASWMARIPLVRDLLGLSPGELGLLLLAISTGSLMGLPAAGALAQRFGTIKAVAGASMFGTGGLAIAAIGAEQFTSVPLTATGLLLMGFGIGVWDVAMNLEGAEVERQLDYTIMPRFHAAFSMGTVLGAGGGAIASWRDVGLLGHLLPVLAVAAVAVLVAVRGFLPDEAVEESREETDSAAPGHPLRAWLEPKTLMIGLMVLALGMTEGTANDWLAVALVDGYGVPDWAGAAGFAVFVSAMTLGRVVGTVVLDRFGRVPVLWSTMGLAGFGVLVTVFSPWVPLALVGIVLWGLGASLGFPVGMSAAADDPKAAAARVSVVSTIGYTAFLAGPPLIGFVAEHVGTLKALLVVAIMLVPSALVVPAARETRSRRQGRRDPDPV